MKTHHLLPILLSATLCTSPALAEEKVPSFPPASQSIGKIERLKPEFDALVPPGAVIEVLSSGYEWTEGPVWFPDADAPGGGRLLFSEIPSNTIRELVPGGSAVFLTPSGYTGRGKYSAEPGSNGLAVDLKGQLLACEHGDRRISVLTTGGGKRTVTDNFDGKRFNSPNDLTVAKNGDVYFTDPIYGLPKREKDPLRELDWCGVYRWNQSTGKVTLESKALQRPNGVAFSPDEKTLYVAQSDPKAAIWMSFPVKADGSLGEGKTFQDATPMAASGKHKGLPDGMKVDAKGNVWATGPGGVHVMSPDGTLLGRIETGESTSNCAFAPGYLYMTVDMHVCRVKIAAK